MIYYDKEVEVMGKKVLIKEVKRVREIKIKDAFKLFVISKFLEKPVAILTEEKKEGIRFRYGVPVLNKKTIKNIEESFFVFKGGRYYKIDSEKLLRKIAEKGLSICEFCRKVGISKRNFYNYLKGQMIHEENYEKIEKIIGDVKEKDVSKILKVREFRFRIEFNEKVMKAYNIVKKFLESYILGNEFVDLCLKGKGRIVVKISEERDENEIEKAAEELKSRPLVIKRPEDIRIVVMNY